MATIYVSPLGGGNGSGASAANPMKFNQLDSAVQAAGPGGTVILLSDQGAYNLSSTITISRGGTDGAPIVIMGANSAGIPTDITINGTRDPNWSLGKADGNEIFRLVNGANNLVFDGFDFNNVGMAFKLGGDLRNVTIQNMEADNVRYFIGNYAAGGASTASVSGLTVRDVAVHGFSKSVVILKYNTNNVVIDNVFGDSEYQDGDSFAMGVMLDGTVHDVLIRNTTMMNAIGSSATGSYWNGDGFVAERGVYNLRFENTRASGNADGGYDLKSTNTVLVNAVAEDNARNFRIWGDAELINPVGIDPHVRGGSSSQAQLWVSGKAVVTGGQFVDSGGSTKVFESSGGTIALSSTKVVHASSALTSGSGISGTSGLQVTKIGSTGSYSTNGEIYLSGTATTTSPVSPVPVSSSIGVFGGPAGDFNGDGRDDVLWRNPKSSEFVLWLGKSDGGYASSAAGYAVVDNGWKIAGTGDFNGDGRDDVLWRHSTSGEVVQWLGQTNGGFAANAAAYAVVDNGWTIAGTGDFNGDGRDDVLWRHSTSGEVVQWLSKANGSFASNAAAYTVVDRGWMIAGTGDLNGDGREDVLWRHSTSGEVVQWLGQANGAFAGNGAGYAVVDNKWKIAGTGDFNGDGRDDFLWRHSSSGEVVQWLSKSNGSFASNAAVYAVVDAKWQIASTGDFNGDGRDDVLWRNSTSGEVSQWVAKADGSFASNAAAYAVVDNNWHVQPADSLWV